MNTNKEIGNKVGDGYFAANLFFRSAAKRKDKEAAWYFNHGREMENKASLALDWRDYFNQQASEYLELMIIARGGGDA